MAGGFGAGPFGAAPFGSSGGVDGVPATGLRVTAALVGDPGEPPRRVQITVAGLTPGEPFVITGRDDHGNAWQVRGTGPAATSEAAILGDAAGSINTPRRYEVVQGGVAATSKPVTVDYPGRQVIQSLDGFTTVPLWWIANGDPRDRATRQAMFQIPGRRHPVARVDTGMGDTGRWLIHTIQPYTQRLLDLLDKGGPIMLRTDGQVEDIPATEVVLVNRLPRRLSGGYRSGQNARQWDIEWTAMDDPEPLAVTAVATMADFDAVWAGKMESDFDAAWAGRTEADFDAFDWAGEAAR